MLLPRLRLSRATPVVPRPDVPDPADMGTCFGLELAMQADAEPEPRRDTPTRRSGAAPAARALRPASPTD